ncbi:MAG: sugar kinase [Leucobacter sp.]
MNARPTVACVGETMAMVTPTTRTPLTSSETFSVTPGGAESNVAAHLAARGFPTYWMSRLGDDALGDRIESVLSDRGIDLSKVVRDPAAHTGVYFKDPEPGQRSAVSYYRAGSAASRMSVADADDWSLDRFAWLHTSGITAALSTLCCELVEHLLSSARRFGYGTSFDVNYRPALISREEAADRYLRLGRLSTVVLVGLDEAQAIWQVETPEQVADLFPEVPYLVVKDGAREAVEFSSGSTAATAEPRTTVRIPARSVDVVEAVGAGDAFAAGYLCGLLEGATSQQRLTSGHELAAWTLGSLYDFRPFPDVKIPPADQERTPR